MKQTPPMMTDAILGKYRVFGLFVNVMLGKYSIGFWVVCKYDARAA